MRLPASSVPQRNTRRERGTSISPFALDAEHAGSGRVDLVAGEAYGATDARGNGPVLDVELGLRREGEERGNQALVEVQELAGPAVPRQIHDAARGACAKVLGRLGRRRSARGDSQRRRRGYREERPAKKSVTGSSHSRRSNGDTSSRTPK